MKRALLILVPILLGSCHGDDLQQEADLEEEFSVRQGQTITIEDEQLVVRLKSVDNESRCPVKLRCVWRGNAQVRLLVSKGGKPPSTISLNTAGMRKYPNERKYLDYSIKLTALTPHPTSNKPIPQSSYAATVIISK